MTGRNIKRCAIDAAAMAMVAGLSFLLLVYVGFGEANRSYERFYVGKLTAQAKVLVNAIENYLKRDLPLEQYVGFRPRAERLLNSDNTVVAISVFGRSNNQIFSSGDIGVGILPRHEPKVGKTSEDGPDVRRSDTYLQVLLPLENNREVVGSIAISMRHALISEQVKERFVNLIPLGIGLSIAFGVFVGAARKWITRQPWPVLQLVYAGLFLVVASLVIGNLVALYAKGTQIKTKALADSLGHRMTEVVGFKLDIAQIPGLDQAFAEYRRLNPEIAAAALVVDGIILIHTDSFMVGQPWESARGVYEYMVDISPGNNERQVHIAVTLPQEIVYWQTARSVKNFAALFIASAFLASLFLQLAGSVHRPNDQRSKKTSRNQADDGEQCLKLVKPVFYVTMCVEHLSYAFLASYIDGVVDSSGLTPSLTAAIFAIYYLAFALTLIPAGHLAQQFNPKPLMIYGLFLSASSFLLLMQESHIVLLVLARMAAGIGQAMLFIGVQSFILTVASPERKTQGAAIIVYGFQGGMISGMAIGSLLVGYVGPDGVFAVGAVATTFTLIYATSIVPTVAGKSPAKPAGIGTSLRTLGGHALMTLRSPGLLQVIALIGIPAKAVLTGIVVFAIPLLMTREGYRQEDIGQLLMLYAGGVVLANEIISRWVDRTGDSRGVLVFGALLSGIGLWLVGRLGLGWFDDIAYGASVEVFFVLIGIVVLGLAHGLINAPIVSHVASHPIGEKVGVGTLTATYRFLERIGHVAGPLLVGQMFVWIEESAQVLTCSGILVASFGFIYFWLNRRYKPVDRSRRRAPPAAAVIDLVEDVVGLQLDSQHQALVLRMRRSPLGGTQDAAQRLLFDHLAKHGANIDARELMVRVDDWKVDVLDVSTVIANRRRALRFRRFLTDVSDSVPGQQPLLLVICSAHLGPSGFDLAAWLDHRPGSRLVIVPEADSWLDQVRGWLVLLSLDAKLGAEHGGAEILLQKLKVHLGGGGGEFSWIATPSPQLSCTGDTTADEPRQMPFLRAVGR